MCDTFVATPDATADGRMLLAKNSDREPIEAQALEVIAGRAHPSGTLVRCTRVDVPQARRTRSVLIGRPYWMWGAEMGVNDAGVSIGNEAVMTRAPLRSTGLLGMDLLRLGLERADSARHALGLITELIQEHGQGGRAGLMSDFRYHNSFLIADSEDAWLLETADRAWVAQRVRGIRAISNGLSVRDDWDLAAANLSALARDYGVDAGKGRLDFARAFSSRLLTWGAAAGRRRQCTEAFLRRHDGNISVGHALRALRQHGSPDRPSRAAGSPRMTVCAHASWTPMRSSSQTTGSILSSMGDGGATAFATATSAACLSVFKPVWIDGSVLSGCTPGGRYDPRHLWWRHERLHRRALVDLDASLALLSAERDALEVGFIERAFEARASATRRDLSAEAFRASQLAEERWLERLAPLGRALPGRLYERYFQRLDRLTGLPS